jgi:hypothetical protein
MAANSILPSMASGKGTTPTSGGTEDDHRLWTWLEDLASESMRVRREEADFDDFDEHLDMYYGRHWPSTIPSFRPPVVVNELRTLILSEASDLTESQLRVYITKDPRNGLPLTYKITYTEENGKVVVNSTVHWSRVIHIADDCLESEVFGNPLLALVYNRLQDIETILSGGAEMFWRGGFPGMSAQADAGARLTDADKTAVKEQFEKYYEDLARKPFFNGLVE